jgi:hypothetical protein
MAEQICPVCGCSVVAGGYKKGGKVYCCQPCAERAQCACGCCAPKEKGKKTGNK